MRQIPLSSDKGVGGRCEDACTVLARFRPVHSNVGKCGAIRGNAGQFRGNAWKPGFVYLIIFAKPFWRD